MRLILIIIATVILQGCAIFMPYSENFSCERGIGEGYCGSVSDNYEYSIKLNSNK